MEQQSERPQLLIHPRRDVLARYGIRLGDFSNAIGTALGGSVVGQVYDEGYSYDVTVIVDEAHRASMEDIGALTIDSPQGKVPLEAIAEITSTTGPNAINRENVGRRITVSSNVAGRDLGSTVEEIRRRVAEEVELPEGYYVTYGGQFENQKAATRTLMLTSIFSILIIFMLMYSEFRNIPESLIIMVNMPLALIGGVLILFFSGSEFNIPAVIGFISLMGISTRNGMLLMSRYNALDSEGLSLAERIAHGSSDRLLPIVMTALTSALALIPLAVNGDAPGNEIQSPMALVILGGLLSSTLLNIYVVPALYQMLKSRKP